MNVARWSDDGAQSLAVAEPRATATTAAKISRPLGTMLDAGMLKPPCPAVAGLSSGEYEYFMPFFSLAQSNEPPEATSAMDRSH